MSNKNEKNWHCIAHVDDYAYWCNQFHENQSDKALMNNQP